MRIDSLAENIDLAPTFEELAGHSPSPAVEGRSLVPLLEGRQPADWRQAVLVEHHGPDSNPSDPDFQEPGAGNPPTYEAIRLKNEVYVEYVDGEHEYYDIAKDPFELRNTYADLGPARRRELHRALDEPSQLPRRGCLPSGRSAAPAGLEPTQHAGDVAADHAEVVAALLHEDGRHAQAARSLRPCGDSRRQRAERCRSPRLRYRRRARRRARRARSGRSRRVRRRAPGGRSTSRCRGAAGSCAWSPCPDRRPVRRRSPRRTGIRVRDRHAGRRSTPRRESRRSAACRCRGGSRRRGSRCGRPGRPRRPLRSRRCSRSSSPRTNRPRRDDRAVGRARTHSACRRRRRPATHSSSRRPHRSPPPTCRPGSRRCRASTTRTLRSDGAARRAAARGSGRAYGTASASSGAPVAARQRANACSRNST